MSSFFARVRSALCPLTQEVKDEDEIRCRAVHRLKPELKPEEIVCVVVRADAPHCEARRKHCLAVAFVPFPEDPFVHAILGY